MHAFTVEIGDDDGARCHNERVSPAENRPDPDPAAEPTLPAFGPLAVHRPHGGAERSAVIDLAAIRHNVRRLAEIAHPARLMAVVKADGYGHGAVPVARAALAAGAHALGTAHVGEALELRRAGITAPLLAWLHTADTDFEAALRHDIALGVSGAELFEIARTAQRIGVTARLHLKVDTGLGRNGFAMGQWPEAVRAARELEQEGRVVVDGIFSHLAVADEPQRAETAEQLAVFADAVRIAREAGLRPRLRHIANTPGTLSLAEPGGPDPEILRGDMVRTGVGIYGVSPFADRSPEELGLLPAMTLRTSVANLKRVPAEQGVSYGLSYRTAAETTLALIPVGYGDGVPRVATGAPVRIQGRTYPVAGRIAMDQLVVDLQTTEDVSALLGAEAVLFGSAEEAPSVREWADAAGTIDYEIITRISPRMQRVYVDTRRDLAADRVAEERLAGEARHD